MIHISVLSVWDRLICLMVALVVFVQLLDCSLWVDVKNLSQRHWAQPQPVFCECFAETFALPFDLQIFSVAKEFFWPGNPPLLPALHIGSGRWCVLYRWDAFLPIYCTEQITSSLIDRDTDLSHNTSIYGTWYNTWNNVAHLRSQAATTVLTLLQF